MLDVEGPMDLIDPPPNEPTTSRKRPLWLKDTFEDAEKHIAPRGTFRVLSHKLSRQRSDWRLSP